jgi:hypothetical protein
MSRHGRALVPRLRAQARTVECDAEGHIGVGAGLSQT